MRIGRSRMSGEKLLPLPDYLSTDLAILFVGINPGIRSAEVGHHYAGPSNRFWKLLFDGGLVSEPLAYHDDWRLPSFGYGLTNIVSRPTKGIQDLKEAEFRQGKEELGNKVQEFQPQVIALLGIGIAHHLFPRAKGEKVIEVGVQSQTFLGIPVFVLPNPSGRNAHYSYESMKTNFKELKSFAEDIKFVES